MIDGLARAATTLDAILRAYRGCSIGTIVRVMGRYMSCPVEPILSAVPSAGRVVDVGCGDGLLLFLLSREKPEALALLGIDIDERKIANARSARFSRPVDFRVTDVSRLDTEAFDCVALIDVLYVVRKDGWQQFLEHSVRVLKPDGVLIVKEVAKAGRWKYWFSLAQEIVSVRIIGMTKGDAPHIESVETYSAAIHAAGADVYHVDHVGAGRPHAHVLLLARKRNSGDPPS